MKLEVLRVSSQKDSTNGLLFDVTDERKFLCYTLEDEYREDKVKHETRIPEGTYKITLRKVGGFHSKYSERYGKSHYGMLHLQDVPNFTYILIHAGNTDEHTSGCLIVGETQQDLDISDDGFIGHSGKAYSKLYNKVAKELLLGKEVSIEYTTINKLLKKPLSNASTDDVVLARTVMDKLEEVNGNVLVGNAMLKGRIIR